MMADFPSILPDNENVELRANNQRFDSELTNSRQSGSLSGPQWFYSATFNNRAGLEARELSTFIMALNGISTPFNYYPAHIEQLGTHSGNGLVEGAGQTGTTIQTSGWDYNQSLLFALGDYITINGELKRVTANVDASSIADTYITYDGTNYMPSPFDPSGWFGSTGDPDSSYTQITEANPSGEATVGQFEYVGSGGSLTLLQTGFDQPMVAGEFAYFSILFKPDPVNPIPSLRVFFQYDDSGTISDGTPVINASTGVFEDFQPSGWDTKITELGNGYNLLQVRMLANFSFNYRCVVYAQNKTGTPNNGEKSIYQAAYFGKASDYPANILANAEIPFTPALRKSPDDQTAIEANNPYAVVTLENDEQARMQVSSPIIYSATFNMLEFY